MLVIRYLMTASVGAILTLVWGTSATAQTVSPPRTKFEKLSQVEHRNTNVAQIQEQPAPPARESLPGLEPAQPSQAPAETRKDEPAPENLDPSANPLQFPTRPEEVDIENVQPITLNQAIELALRNNRDLREARITLERRQAELQEAQAALLPNLSTQVQFDRSGNTTQIPSSPTQRNPFTGEVIQQAQDARLGFSESTNFQGNLELSYNIYTGGRRGAQIERSERALRQSELDVERLAEETRFNATDRYYLLQNADAQVAIAQAAVEDATQSLRDAQLLEQAGLGTRFDTLRSEVDLARANQQLTRAISAQRTARRNLAEVLSVGQQVELTAADEIREAGRWSLSLEESIVQAYKNRAELEQQLLQREISERDRTIALADIKPQVDFFAQYNFNDNFDDEFGIGDGYSFGARMRWTLFDGGAAFARARQADRNIDLANNAFARQRNQIRTLVETAYYELIANQENIETTRLNVQRAEESLRLARLRFQAGVGTQTDVINSQRDLTDARSEFLQAIIGYNQSLNQLQRQVSNQPDNRLFEFR
jgi:OMF family outer membrane factor